MPVFAAGHSLGCKLQLIAACGDGDGGDEAVETVRGSRAGHLFVSFNNATAADSVRLLEKFARELLKKRAEGAMGDKADQKTKDAFDGFMRNMPNLTALAERAAAAAGLDFTPSPEETLDAAKRRFVSPRVKLVTFQDDDLDQNDELEANLRRRFEFLVAGRCPGGEDDAAGQPPHAGFFSIRRREAVAGVRQAWRAERRGRGGGDAIGGGGGEVPEGEVTAPERGLPCCF